MLAESATRVVAALRPTAELLVCSEVLPPKPSRQAYVPLPASVLTAPSSVTARRNTVSVTTRCPAGESARPRGLKKAALVPTPSTAAPHAPTVPASVVTAPLLTATARTTQLVVSVTYSTLAAAL